MKFLRFALINSILVWSVIAAGFDLGLGFDWWTFTVPQITLLHAFYIALVMMFRQFFSLVGDDVATSPAVPPTFQGNGIDGYSAPIEAS